MPSFRSPAIAFLVLCLTSSASADVVTDWNTAALATIRIERTTPPVAARALAILHVAIYDAVNGIDRTHTPFFVGSLAPASAPLEAAAAAAAHRVLAETFPRQTAAFDALRATQLSAIGNSPQTRAGESWGDEVARHILTQRADDGAAEAVAAPIADGPGGWTPTLPAAVPYLLPQWGFVRPFGLESGRQFRPDGPPALDSQEYASEVNEVRLLGSLLNSTRSDDETMIALFWADGAGTETPPGHWNRIAQDVAAGQSNSLAQNARLFALLNIALADAGIVAWDAKFAYNFWRPVTAIRSADIDGNAATTADPEWTPLLVTPPFPDYVSGHSTFSAAAAVVLARFYGTDAVAFTTGSDAMPSVRRRFESFSAAAAEAAMSRIYGGIHFRSASEDGIAAGVDVGVWTYEHLLLPKGNRSDSHSRLTSGDRRPSRRSRYFVINPALQRSRFLEPRLF
jgi:membrane-associated phospholipid phosphatase